MIEFSANETPYARSSAPKYSKTAFITSRNEEAMRQITVNVFVAPDNLIASAFQQSSRLSGWLASHAVDAKSISVHMHPHAVSDRYNGDAHSIISSWKLFPRPFHHLLLRLNLTFMYLSGCISQTSKKWLSDCGSGIRANALTESDLWHGYSVARVMRMSDAQYTWLWWNPPCSAIGCATVASSWLRYRRGHSKADH